MIIMTYVIGVDIGTSGLKSIVVNKDGGRRLS